MRNKFSNVNFKLLKKREIADINGLQTLKLTHEFH